jgi:multiple sugar transport system substrate-binding protein
MTDPSHPSPSAPSRRDFLKYAATAGVVAAGAPALGKLGSTGRLASARYSFAPKSTTKLTLWQVDSPTVKGDGFAQLQALAKQFTQKHHIDITLDYVQFTSGVGSFQEKVAAAAASNNPPDIVQLSGADSYAYTGAARSLDKYLSSSSVIKPSDFIPGQWARNVWAGTVYGIPIGADANALFWWNRDLFKKYGLNPDAPPATWDELLSMSERISKSQSAKKVDTLGYIVTYGQSWNLVYYYLLGPKFLTTEQGGDAWAPGKPSPKVLFNDENGIKALEYVVQLADANGGAQLLSSFSSGFASGLQDPFITGKIAMQCNGNWNQGVYAQYAPHLNYGVSQMPLPPHGVKCSTSGGFCWSIPTKANAPDEAWSWIEFASEPENQLFYVKGLGTNPTRLALLGDRYFQSNPVRKVAVEAIKNARGWGESPWAGVLWQQYMLNARDQAIYHKATPKAALDTAAAVVQQSIDSYTRG